LWMVLHVACRICIFLFHVLHEVVGAEKSMFSLLRFFKI
jgi:hypothetical protein